jgi:carbon monoxide dehydrogenase subunit G
MLIEGQFPVAAPPHALMRHLFDARLMASCLPGCESLEPLDAERYRAVVVIAMAGIKARFNLEVQITRRDESNVWATTRGEEGGNASSLQADSQVSLAAAPEGTLVTYGSEVSVSGRLGRFALGMMKKKAQSMGEEFADNLRRKLEALEAPAAAPEPAVMHEPARPPKGLIPECAARRYSSAPAPSPALQATSAGSTPEPTPGAAAAQGPNAPPAVPEAQAKRTAWWLVLWAWLRGKRIPDSKAGA